MSVKEYQARLKDKLNQLFEEVSVEWRPFPNREEGYAPIPDIAIGPFAVERNCEVEYNELVNQHEYFIQLLIETHNQNAIKYFPVLALNNLTNVVNSNSNARCLFCIEIENKVSRKHIIGGLINASALGRVAVLIGWDSKKVKSMFEQRKYMSFLQRVGKNHFFTGNVVILSPQQFEECVDSYIEYKNTSETNAP